MQAINIGIIGTGWCCGIRAEACAASSLVDQLHIAEINPDEPEPPINNHRTCPIHSDDGQFFERDLK